MIVKLRNGFVVRTADGKRNLSKEGISYKEAQERLAQCERHAQMDKEKKKKK